MNRVSRAVHIDFHNLPGIREFGQAFDPEQFARQLKEAHVTSANIFAQCNIGFSYYPTGLGTPYPAMTGDLFGDMVQACGREGIRTVAYVNAGINHELARKHYDWCRVDETGHVLHGDRTDSFCRTMCYNRPDYLTYLLGVVGEILQYKIDGMFFDCMFPFPCYCNQCTEDMLKQGLDVQNPDHAAAFALKRAVAFAGRLRAALPEGFSFFANGLPMDWLQGINTHMELECLPSSGWGYDYFIPMAAYARSLYDSVIYMTGRFQTGWGDFGGFKAKDSMENDLYDALCQNCGVCIGDHMHPVHGLEPGLYREIGGIFHMAKQYEPWTKGAKVVAEVGVLRNRSDSAHPVLTQSLQGAARMLSELKLCFDVINQDLAFDRYRLLILPDELEIDETTQIKLRAFLRGGGAVLGSGTAGLKPGATQFVLPEFDFLTSDGLEEEPSYYRLTGGKTGQPYLAAYLPGIRMRASGACQVTAERVPAYFCKKWDGLHGYCYTPPSSEADGCAAAENGCAAHIAFPVFQAYFQYAYVEHKRLAAAMIERLMPNPCIRAQELPASARITLTQNGPYVLLHIKVTRPELRGAANVIEAHDVLPEGRQIFVRGNFSHVRRLPDESVLAASFDGNDTKIRLPEIVGYAVFLLMA